MDNAPLELFEVLEELSLRAIDWPVIVVSRSKQIAVAVEAMKRGAIDFLPQAIEADDLQTALSEAEDRLSRGAAAARRDAQRRLAALTPRERDIAFALQRGGSNKVIAFRLGISVRTVEAHRANLMWKLGVSSFAEAVLLIARSGLTERMQETARSITFPERFKRGVANQQPRQPSRTGVDPHKQAALAAY